MKGGFSLIEVMITNVVLLIMLGLITQMVIQITETTIAREKKRWIANSVDQWTQDVIQQIEGGQTTSSIPLLWRTHSYELTWTKTPIAPALIEIRIVVKPQNHFSPIYQWTLIRKQELQY